MLIGCQHFGGVPLARVCVRAHGHVRIHTGVYASEQNQVWGICELLQTHAVLSSVGLDPSVLGPTSFLLPILDHHYCKP